MGHRVSANLFRVGLSRTWNSHWFAKSEYTYLLSLDYRVRDFMDFIFYNLKWPTSELQIRRFLSRSVVLELLISIPDDQLVYFLNFTKFIGNICITDNIDPFKFNGLLFEYNYILSNFAYNVLGKSLFFLLLRQYKLNINYDQSLFINFYKNLFYISNNFVEGNNDQQSLETEDHSIYLLKKKKVFVKPKFLDGVFKRQFNKFNINKSGSKHFLVDLLNLFSGTSNGKLYLNKYTKYLLYLNDLATVRGIRKRTSYQIHKLLSNFVNAPKEDSDLLYFKYFGQINKTIKYLIYRYSKYNPYVLLSSYSQIKKFVNTNSNNFKYSINSIKGYEKYNLDSQSSLPINLVAFIKYIVYLNDRLPVKRFNIVAVLLFVYSISELVKEVLIYSPLLTSNKSGAVKFPVFDIFSKNQKFYLSNHIQKSKFVKSSLRGQLFSIINNFPLLLWQKWKAIIRGKSICKSYLGTTVSKSVRQLSKRQKDTGLKLKQNQIPNLRMKQLQVKQSLIDLNSIQKKRKFFINFSNSVQGKLLNRSSRSTSFKSNVIKNNVSFSNKYNVKNIQFVKKNKIQFVSSIVSCMKRLRKKDSNTVSFSNFRRFIYPFLLKNMHYFNGNSRMFDYDNTSVYVDIITYFIRMHRYDKKLFHDYPVAKSRVLRLNKKVELNDVLLLYNTTSVLYSYTRISFFFDSLWYSNIGSSYLKKLSLLYKYSKHHLKTTFAIVYQNLYNLFIFRKFFNFFNYLKLESTVSTSIKFFRFFKKLFFDIKKRFLKKSILLFIIFMYSYLNLRFSRIQLFIRNILTVFIRNDINTEQFSILKQSSVYIFLYYFYNHLKLCVFIIRMLQLYVTFSANILPVKDNHLLDYLQTSVSYPYSIYKRILYINTPRYKKIYLYVKKLNTIQLNITVNLQRRLSITNLPIITLQSYSSFIKLVPDFIRSPYYIIDRDTAFYDIDSIDGTRLPDVTVPLELATSTITYPILFSKQWKQILSQRRPYFFRYVVDRLIYYLDDIRRDSVPIQSLQSFSILIEYSLSTYLKNIVIFMPIYYLSKRVPFYQAKLICLYVSYELEKGIPYFLVLKQIIIHNRVWDTRKHKYLSIKNLDSILGQKIFAADDRFSQLVNFEFIAKYQKEWQSKTIFKYFIFRNFYSLGTARRFQHKLGLRISCSGRMYRRQTRSHTMWFVEGALPLRSFEKYIEFYSSAAVTNLGTIGVKVWSFLVQIPTLS